MNKFFKIIRFYYNNLREALKTNCFIFVGSWFLDPTTDFGEDLISLYHKICGILCWILLLVLILLIGINFVHGRLSKDVQNFFFNFFVQTKLGFLTEGTKLYLLIITMFLYGLRNYKGWTYNIFVTETYLNLRKWVSIWDISEFKIIEYGWGSGPIPVIVWMITGAFGLNYANDGNYDPIFSVGIEGQQWSWNYSLACTLEAYARIGGNLGRECDWPKGSVMFLYFFYGDDGLYIGNDPLFEGGFLDIFGDKMYGEKHLSFNLYVFLLLNRFCYLDSDVSDNTMTVNRYFLLKTILSYFSFDRYIRGCRYRIHARRSFAYKFLVKILESEEYFYAKYGCIFWLAMADIPIVSYLTPIGFRIANHPLHSRYFGANGNTFSEVFTSFYLMQSMAQNQEFGDLMKEYVFFRDYTDFYFRGKWTISYKYNSSLIDVNYFGENIRLQTVDKELLLPMDVPLRLNIVSSDVLHSFALPNAGIKADAVPGRLNDIVLTFRRPGKNLGLCSELCGINHAFMPIVIRVVPFTSYFDYCKISIFYDYKGNGYAIDTFPPEAYERHCREWGYIGYIGKDAVVGIKTR